MSSSLFIPPESGTVTGGGGAGRRLSAEGFPPRPPDFNVERREGLLRPAQKRAFILQG